MNINDTKKILDIKGDLSSQPMGGKMDLNSNMNKSKGLGEDKAVDDKNMLNFLTNKMKEMETEFDTNEHLVLDLGNAFTKVGFSGEDLPKMLMPSIFGSLQNEKLDKKSEISFEIKPNLYGYEVYENKYKDLYSKKNLIPGDQKQVIDSEYVSLLKEILENKININPTDYYVILNSSPIKNNENIIKVGKMLIEELNFKGFAMINSASLSLFSTGRTSGLVCECGEKRSYIVPIYEGFPLYHALNKNKLGGHHLTEIIKNEIIQSNLGVNEDDLFNLRCIKEKMCYVPYTNDINHYLDSNEDIIPEEKKLYKLPDEKIIEIPKKARLTAAELLFTPGIHEFGQKQEHKGLVRLIGDSVKKTIMDNDDIKKIMLNNIVLSGGTTMMPGFSNRINMQLKEVLNRENISYSSYKVIAEGNRNISAWIGASMISSMSSFNNVFITREEYNENGENKLNIFQKIF